MGPLLVTLETPSVEVAPTTLAQTTRQPVGVESRKRRMHVRCRPLAIQNVYVAS